MAAARQQQELRKLDELCEYTKFSARVEGKVACLGLGPSTPADIVAAPLGAITSICFQRVNKGIVKAALPVDDFSPVTWVNAPTNPPAANPTRLNAVRLLHDEYHLGRVNHVENMWLEFTDAVSCVKAGMLERMTPASMQRPEYLLDGFQMGVWRGAAHDNSSRTKLRQIKQDVGRNLNWNVKIERWLESLAGGLNQNVGQRFRDLLMYLLPRCQSSDQDAVAPDPMDTNGSLSDGTVEWLVYGYNTEQWAQVRGRARDRQLRHRFLFPRGNCNKSRSRSRSHSSSDDDDEDLDLETHVQDGRNLHKRTIRNSDLYDEPDEYILKPRRLHTYFESRRPDVLVWKCDLVPDAGSPGNLKEEFTAKIIVEISSSKKHEYDITKHVAKNVDQCVQSCLAGLAVNQALMYGLVVVVDGFVLIKVERVQNQRGRYEYKVSETDLITWDNRQSLHGILQELKNIL